MVKQPEGLSLLLAHMSSHTAALTRHRARERSSRWAMDAGPERHAVVSVDAAVSVNGTGQSVPGRWWKLRRPTRAGLAGI